MGGVFIRPGGVVGVLSDGLCCGYVLLVRNTGTTPSSFRVIIPQTNASLSYGAKISLYEQRGSGPTLLQAQ